MKSLKLAILNIRKNIKNEKELKSAFIISIVGMMLNNAAFIVLWYYFGKIVGELNGWKAEDIFGLYAINTVSYGIVSGFLNGIFQLPTYITTATLDRYLLTPKNILMKISTSKISTSAFGDLLYGIVCFVIFIFLRDLSIPQILFSILLMIISTVIFYSFSVICMTLSFYMMDGKNVSEGFYGMFLSNSLYHGGAFTGLLRFLFIFVVPSLLLGAIPVELVNDFNLNKFLLLIGLTILWLIISILFFKKSLKKYESNNLFGFGN